MVTFFWLVQARSVEMYSQFSDLLPQSHPYVEAYNHHKGLFGGAANVLTMVLQVKDGDISERHRLYSITMDWVDRTYSFVTVDAP